MISFNDYQKATERTAGKFEHKEDAMACWAMGLSGEAGEATDDIKKVLFHGHNLDRQRVCKELGDVLWYLARLAATAGLQLSEVAEHNLAKLNSRYPDGFSHERSINRK